MDLGSPRWFGESIYGGHAVSAPNGGAARVPDAPDCKQGAAPRLGFGKVGDPFSVGYGALWANCIFLVLFERSGGEMA